MKSQTIFDNCMNEIARSARGAIGVSDDKALEQIRDIEVLCRMSRTALGAKSLEEEILER
jgi:hypothetical protein